MAEKKLYEETTGRDSYGGSIYDRQYFTDDELRAAAAARAAAESGETSWQSAHDYVEGIRNKYGYAGGADGSGYIAVSNPTTQPVKSTAPSYVSKYQDQIDTLKDAMINRTPFSYDALSDPLYQQYRKQYTREAGRSAEDVLGKAAALTGGMPSTAAITASQQASDYQKAKMNDKIPELQQLAYSMYLNEGNRMNDQLNMLLGLEQNDYNRYLTDREYEYQLGRDALADQRYADELAYARERDAIADARYADELAYERQMAAQKLAQQGSKASGSGGTKASGGASGATGSVWDDVDAYVGIGGNAEDYIKANYKALGYSSQSAAIAAYNVYKTQQKASAPKSVIGMDSLDYDPDEGIFTWNGTKYNSVEKLQAALNSAAESGAINDATISKLKRYLNAYGFNA